MNLKRYTVYSENVDFFFEAEIEVNLDIMTVELATEINKFWSEADARLAHHGDDVVKTVVGLAAGRFVKLTQDGHSVFGCVARLQSEEGWPTRTGLKLISIDAPELRHDDIIVKEKS